LCSLQQPKEMCSSNHSFTICSSCSDKVLSFQLDCPQHHSHPAADVFFFQMSARSAQQLAERSANKQWWARISAGRPGFSRNLSACILSNLSMPTEPCTTYLHFILIAYLLKFTIQFWRIFFELQWGLLTWTFREFYLPQYPSTETNFREFYLPNEFLSPVNSTPFRDSATASSCSSRILARPRPSLLPDPMSHWAGPFSAPGSHELPSAPAPSALPPVPSAPPSAPSAVFWSS
jgi:hypothetical protein